MLSPANFSVNQAWLAFKINDEPIELAEGSFDTYVVMDAGSAYVIGLASAKSGEYPPANEIDSIFMSGWNQKKAFPEKLIFPLESHEGNAFKSAALLKGIRTEQVPLKDLEPIIGPFREQFKAKFSFIKK